MTARPQHTLQAAVIIALLCVPIFLFVISTQTTAELNYFDNFWYLNRARLIWRGILPDLFVYTLSYPTLVGFVNQIVNDVLLAGMLVNAFLLWCILFGVYLLGCWLFGRRRVAWVAVLLVLLNASLMDALRLFWATVPFMTATVWCVVAAVQVVRRPTLLTALGLGALLALATYTRVEGTVYTLFIPAAAWAVFKQRGRNTALQVLFTSGCVFAVLCVPFALNFLYVRQHLAPELSTGVTGILTLFNRTPVEWSVIWRRVTDTLTGLISHWSALAWLIGIAGVVWAAPRYRFGQWISAAVIGLNLVYTFVLAIWPYPIHVIFYLPFLGLMLAAALSQLAGHGKLARRLAIALFVLLLVPNVLHFARRASEVPVMAYRASELAATGAALDEWLAQQGWDDVPVYTFCPFILSFSRAEFQLIYRLQFTTGWDAPDKLMPKLRDENALLMLCENEVLYPDWRPVLTEEVPAGMAEVGRFDRYVFYRPDELSE